MLLSIVLALGIVWMSARSKVIPYVVEVDKLGYAITISTALTASNTPATAERMKRYEIAAFIQVCLQRPGRGTKNAERFARTLARQRTNSSSRTSMRMTSQKNPFQIMKHQTVRVQIESIFQAPPKSYEVRWSETALDMSGLLLGTSHLEAILETEISPQSWTDTVISNPLGFYVTRLRQSLPKSLKSVGKYWSGRSGSNR